MKQVIAIALTVAGKNERNTKKKNGKKTKTTKKKVRT